MRKLLRLSLLLGLLVLLALPAAAESATAVTALRTECAVETDGACTVQLSADIEFAPGTEEFVIPVSSSAREISCSMPYTVRGGEGCTLLLLSNPPSGQHSVTVSYRLAETVTDDGSTQLFSVRLLYPAWTCPIEAYQVEVRLPGAFEGMPVFESGYYADLIENYMDIEIAEGQIKAVLNPKQILRDHEAMDMSLELPEGFFDLRFLAGKTVKVDRLLFLGLLALAALYWLAFLRNLPILPKRQAMPPEGGNAGEVPYVLTDRKPDLALMVLQWASLGYLTLTRTRKGRIFLTRQIDMDTERKQFETEIFQTLFARGDHCDLRSAEFLKARRMAAEKPRDYWRERIYDPKGGAPWILRLLALGAGLVLCLACFDLWVASKSWRWLAIVPLTLLCGAACWAVQQLGGFLLRRHSVRTAVLALASAVALLLVGRKCGFTGLMLLNLLLQLGVGLLLRCGGRRTGEGTELAAELLGYRRWLISASPELLKSNLETDPQFFYRILPFAEALRAGRFVVGALDRTRLEDCDWLIWQGKPIKTAPAFYARCCRLLAGLRGERDPGLSRIPTQRRDKPVSTRTMMPQSRSSGRAAPRQNSFASRGNKSRPGGVERRNRP
ncbi:MAG: DUF2207 domain-containing protein [Oscillospiraceae bacterium]|nr:DUF2207 domain-containing protein [Oscillospiraceae bacterium]